MGKYSNIKLAPLQEESTYQEKIDEAKKNLGIIGKPPGQLGLLFLDYINQIEGLEEQLKVLKLHRTAVEQELIEAMSDDDMSSFKTSSGLIFQQEEPYSSVKDKLEYNKWIAKTKRSALLSVPWQSTQTIVKDLLLKGEPLPPGIEVFMKTSLRYRRG